MIAVQNALKSTDWNGVAEAVSKEKSPAFQFYPSDWISDRNVLYMSNEQRGIYIMLVAICWMDGSISADPEYHAEGLRASVLDVEAVLKMFRPSRDGEHPKTLTHKRLDEERSKQQSFRKARSDAGKKGGRPPAEKQKKPKLSTGKAKPKQKKALLSSSPSSIESTTSQNQHPPPSRDGEEDFIASLSAEERGALDSFQAFAGEQAEKLEAQLFPDGKPFAPKDTDSHEMQRVAVPALEKPAQLPGPETPARTSTDNGFAGFSRAGTATRCISRWGGGFHRITIRRGKRGAGFVPSLCWRTSREAGGAAFP